MIFLIPDTEAGGSLARKFSKQGQDGAIILVTEEEREVAKEMLTIKVASASHTAVNMFELDPAKKYIAFVNKELIAIDDLTAINKAYNTDVIRMVHTR